MMESTKSIAIFSNYVNYQRVTFLAGIFRPTSRQQGPTLGARGAQLNISGRVWKQSARQTLKIHENSWTSSIHRLSRSCPMMKNLKRASHSIAMFARSYLGFKKTLLTFDSRVLGIHAWHENYPLVNVDQIRWLKSPCYQWDISLFRMAMFNN